MEHWGDSVLFFYELKIKGKSSVSSDVCIVEGTSQAAPFDGQAGPGLILRRA